MGTQTSVGEIKFTKDQWTHPFSRNSRGAHLVAMDDALISICKQRPPRQYLEIGSGNGGSLVDVLRFSDPHPELIASCDNWGTEHGGHGDKNFLRTAQVIVNEGYKNSVLFFNRRSQEVLPYYVGMLEFDLILVDGNHDPGPATRDLEITWGMLPVGGLVVMDDLSHLPWLEKVFDEFCTSHPVEVLWKDLSRQGAGVFRRTS